MIISLLTSGYSVPVIVMLAIALLSSATLSMLVHENAHGFIALKCGDPTAKVRGRLSMNPLKHFDPIGLVLMLLVGFGWAKPVPINPDNFKDRKKGIILVSLAGVCSNLLLSGLNLFLLWLLYPYLNAICMLETAWRLLGFLLIYFLEYMVIFNVMLAFFNILPIAPLDGFRFVDALLPQGNKYTLFMMRYGNYCLIGFLAICFLLERVGLEQFSVFYQIQHLAIGLVTLVTGG